MTAISLSVPVRPVVGPLRDWLRDQSEITWGVWSGSLPKAETEGVVLTRVGDSTPNALLGTPLLSFTCISPDGATAEQMAATTEDLLTNALPGTEIAPGLVLMGAESEGTVQAPDPDSTARQRYVLTTSLTVKAVEIPDGP